MDPLEDKVRQAIGPEYGFDLSHIHDHYSYFRGIRSKYPILQTGHFFPLHIKPMVSHVLAFCRYDKDELFIVVTSFEPEPCVVSLALDELLIPMHMQDEQMTSEGLWIVNRIREETSCMVIKLSNCKD